VRGELHFDVVVIGAGTAGLTAAALLAEGGARVCVVARGVGSTHLAPGTVDVLGYAPGRVTGPEHALGDFIAANPGHPYALLGTDALAPALQWFADRVEAGPHPGYRYVGGPERNHLLPTAVGAVRPSALVPETMAAGDLSSGGGSISVLATRLLRDFHGSMCAANLAQAGVQASPVEVEIEVERADANSLGLARRFDDPSFRAAFAGRLGSRLRGADRVGVPAVLGLRDPHGAWEDLQERLDVPVFEIPTLPPSVPGLRLYEVLRSALRAAGGRLVLGAPVVGAEHNGTRITAVSARAAGHDVRYLARWFVLATGGFASGALELGSDWVTRDTVLGLPLRGAPGPSDKRFEPDYLAEHPMTRVGVAVDGDLRSEGAENVFVAGAALPGAAPWREGCGEGVALASAHRVAQVVLAESGAAAAPTASESS
jgi:glycerol-3-phosphate dehydrogenase subunit B